MNQVSHPSLVAVFNPPGRRKSTRKCFVNVSGDFVWLCSFMDCHLNKEKKKEVWLSPMTEASKPTANSATNWQHKNFNYTTIADRVRTVSWRNNSYLASVVKPGNFYGFIQKGLLLTISQFFIQYYYIICDWSSWLSVNKANCSRAMHATSLRLGLGETISIISNTMCDSIPHTSLVTVAHTTPVGWL